MALRLLHEAVHSRRFSFFFFFIGKEKEIEYVCQYVCTLPINTHSRKIELGHNI